MDNLDNDNFDIELKNASLEDLEYLICSYQKSIEEDQEMIMLLKSRIDVNDPLQTKAFEDLVFSFQEMTKLLVKMETELFERKNSIDNK